MIKIQFSGLRLMLGLIAALLFGVLIGATTDAQEPPQRHPAGLPHQVLHFAVEGDAIDIAKLEARAIAISQANAPGESTAQAREKLRFKDFDGLSRTNVAAAMIVVMRDALAKPTQYSTVLVQIGTESQQPQVSP